MEIKTAQAIRIEFYGKDDSRSYDVGEMDLMRSYAQQAVRLALESAKRQADVMLLNEYGCHEKDANLFNSILSLADSIIGKLK